MPFVEVEDARVQAQRAQSAHSADAEHDLLAQPAVRLGHVQAVGDVAKVLGIGLDVGVEQEQRHATDLRPPDGDAHVALADRRLDLDALELAHRQLGAAVLRIDLELAAGLVDVLAAEALPVQETDGHEGQAEVAGGLQVVPGQDAEAARVDRQALREPELEREVRDRQRGLGVHEPRMAFVVLAISGLRAVERRLDLRPLEGARDAVVTQLVEEKHRVLACRLPELGVERAEEVLDSRLPGPEQVVGELLEFFQHPNKIVVRKGI